MNRNKNGIHDFFSGRHGMDELSRFLLYISLIFIIIAGIFHLPGMLVTGIILIIIVIFRCLSRNVSARNRENQVYLKLTNNIRESIKRQKLIRADKKTHVIIKCPNCSQKIRIPKGKGEIMIKCPDCRIEFIKTT